MTYKRTKVLVILSLVLGLVTGGLFRGRTSAQTATPGSWTLFPPQSTEYSVVVKPPIKPDGTSSFRLGASVPVKFQLLSAPGAVKFESIISNNNPPDPPPDPLPEPETGDDFSFLTFSPTVTLPFSQLTVLKANYEFTLGNCGGGSLRWSVTFDVGNDNNTIPEEGQPDPRLNDRSIFIYYGAYPNFNECTSGANDQSNVNMIGLTDLRYDTSQIGGTFYDTYAHALELAGTMNVFSVTLALDSGWLSDQRVTLGGAEVNGNLFVPVTGGPSGTCNLPPATITVIEDSAGDISPLNAQRKFVDDFYRTTNDCTYTYNLNTNALFGAGGYRVFVVINGVLVLQSPARFTLH